jgi:hypothetical protein
MPRGVFERTAEYRAKLSAAGKGRTLSAGHREKIAARMRGNRNGAGSAGQIRTPEACQRMSSARRAGSEARNPGLSYTAVRKRLRKERGTPSRCEHCGTTTAKKFEWAFASDGHGNGGFPFSTDLTDYIRLCTSCHVRFDQEGR